jgi:hypothetical protein
MHKAIIHLFQFWNHNNPIMKIFTFMKSCYIFYYAVYTVHYTVGVFFIGHQTTCIPMSVD